MLNRKHLKNVTHTVRTISQSTHQQYAAHTKKMYVLHVGGGLTDL